MTDKVKIEKKKIDEMKYELIYTVEDSSGNKAEATTLMSEATKKIDQACSKGVIVKNTASRKKSSLSKKLNAMA